MIVRAQLLSRNLLILNIDNVIEYKNKIERTSILYDSIIYNVNSTLSHLKNFNIQMQIDQQFSLKS